MTYTQWSRICHVCRRKRLLDTVTLMCAECSGDVTAGGESPDALTGDWVLCPVRRIKVYQEAS